MPEESKRISVLIITQSAELRARLRAELAAAPHLDLREESAGSGEPPDVVIRDPEPRGDSSSPGPPHAPATARTLILTDRLSEEWAGELLSSRAAGAIARSARPAEIIAAIESVAAGLIVFSPGLLAGTQPQPGSARKPPSGALQDPLTPREMDVLGMLSDGLSNKEVARRLHISEHTVKYHLSSVFGKLGVSSRTEAVMVGIQRGIILI